ncbi:MAG: hypothetical protein QME81_04475 [bacterium]|nr:hypothetical protein [bacterium]
MSVTELLETAQFLVDGGGEKKAVVFDYVHWEELLTLLEDLEDAKEIHCLREAESVTLKSAEDSFRQGWKEMLSGDTRPVDELWEGIDAE